MTWNRTLPVTGTFVVDLPNIFLNNWTAIEDISAVEHYGLTDTFAGRHKPGIIPIMKIGETAEITGGTVYGAVGNDMTVGLTRVYTGAWNPLTAAGHSFVMSYRALDYIIATGTSGLIPFDTEVFDILGEYDNTTYQFVALATGFYFVRVQVGILAVGGVDIITWVEQYNSSDVLIASPTTYRQALSVDQMQHGITLILFMTAGDKLKAKLSHSYTSSIVLQGGFERSFMDIYRIC